MIYVSTIIRIANCSSFEWCTKTFNWGTLKVQNPCKWDMSIGYTIFSVRGNIPKSSPPFASIFCPHVRVIIVRKSLRGFGLLLLLSKVMKFFVFYIVRYNTLKFSFLSETINYWLNFFS